MEASNHLPARLVVVDGGATGSRLRAIGPDGATLAAARTGPSSLTLGVAAAWRNLRPGIERVCADAGWPATGVHLVCGLAGGRSPTRQAQFRDEDPLDCADIVIVTDGFASLIGAHGGRAGAVLAIGTGVAAYALDRDDRMRSASAWGFVIGDEGGGAWIGRTAVSALCRNMDGRAPGDSAVFAPLGDRVGTDFNAIQLWLTQADSTLFASLAPLVIDADRAGDALAGRIMDAATAELELALAAVATDGPVALLGGLADTFRPRFGAALSDRVVAASGGPLDGLVHVARSGWRAEPAEGTPRDGAARHAG